jgi:hypothetical protein
VQGWTLQHAVSVNDHGVILVTAYHDGVLWAALLLPQENQGRLVARGRH